MLFLIPEKLIQGMLMEMYVVPGEVLRELSICMLMHGTMLCQAVWLDAEYITWFILVQKCHSTVFPMIMKSD